MLWRHADCAANLHKLNDFKASFATLILCDERLVPPKASGKILLSHTRILSGSDQPLQQLSVLRAAQRFQELALGY
jgi:hypothetical protein